MAVAAAAGVIARRTLLEVTRLVPEFRLARDRREEGDFDDRAVHCGLEPGER
jgi:hypothetical protein